MFGSTIVYKYSILSTSNERNGVNEIDFVDVAVKGNTFSIKIVYCVLNAFIIFSLQFKDRSCKESCPISLIGR